MNDLSNLRTAWYKAQENTMEALKNLLDNWDKPSAHGRYQRATMQEKTAETQYLQALAGRTKPVNFKKA